MSAVKKTNGGVPPVRVFVGTSASGEDAEAQVVLEHTLRRQSSRPIDLTWLRLSHDPSDPGHGWQTERWQTPWTGLRWAVPELCAWSGRAIYLDCAQIIRGDVAELLDASMPPGVMVLLRRSGRVIHTGCMVWDCEVARGIVPTLAALRADVGAHQAVGELLTRRPKLVGELPAGWDVRDVEFSQAPDDAMGSVHCANLYMQPHARLAIPRLRRAGMKHWFDAVRMRHFCTALPELFDREYAAAQAAGYSVEQYVPSEVYGSYEIKTTSSNLWGAISV